jgi:hypothetical protein
MAANASHGIDIVVPTTFESRNSRASLPLDIPSDQPVRLQIAPLDTVRRLFAIPTATSSAAISNGGFTSIADGHGRRVAQIAAIPRPRNWRGKSTFNRLAIGFSVSISTGDL